MVTRTLDQLDYEVKHGQARITIISKARPTAQPTTDHRLRLMAAAPVGMLAAVLGAVRPAGGPRRAGRRPGRPAAAGPPGGHRRDPPPAVAPGGPRALGPRPGPAPRRRRGVRPEPGPPPRRPLRRPGGRRRPAACVLITSACGGEGKTTLAAHLAGRCANAGLRTLLIDADLRRPRLATLLGVPAGPGLADVLAGDVEPGGGPGPRRQPRRRRVPPAAGRGGRPRSQPPAAGRIARPAPGPAARGLRPRRHPPGHPAGAGRPRRAAAGPLGRRRRAGRPPRRQPPPPGRAGPPPPAADRRAGPRRRRQRRPRRAGYGYGYGYGYSSDSGDDGAAPAVPSAEGAKSAG